MREDESACWEGLDAAREVGAALRTSLGPNACLKLVTPGPGVQAATVTGSGSILTGALAARGLIGGHPAARLVVDSASSLSEQVGAGGSQLAIMVSAAVDAIERQGLVKARASLQRHGMAVIERLLESAKGSTLVAGAAELQLAAAAVLATAMCGKISQR